MASILYFDYDNEVKIWLGFLKDHKASYLWGIFFVILTNIAQVFSTRLFGFLIDFFEKQKMPLQWIAGETTIETFFNLFFLLLFTRLVLTTGRIGWRLTLARQTHHAAGFLREKVWDVARLFRIKDLRETFSKGILMNYSNSDVNSARFLFGFTLVGIVDFVFLVLITVITMLSIHVPLTLASFAALLVIPPFVKKLSQIEIKNYRIAQDKLGELNDSATKSIATVKLQKLTHTGLAWIKRLCIESEEYRQKRLQAAYTNLLFGPLMGVGSILGYIVLFFLGLYYVIEAQISVGDFVAMQGLIFLLSYPLMELGNYISEWQKGLASLRRLENVYGYETDPHLDTKDQLQKEHPYAFEVKNLSFSYNSDRPIIENLSFSLRQGGKLGIVGPIGAGKSTLVNLLSGLEREHQGEILFRGLPFSHYSHSKLREMITLIPQKSFLFASSIAQNISMDQDLSEEEIWKFLELAALKEEVKNFPHGIHTELGEWGVNLSGGQKQRLTLARALARNPKILFLDDCLSAVDTTTEKRILENLSRKLKDCTLIWVAHRTSTLRNCDQILELSHE